MAKRKTSDAQLRATAKHQRENYRPVLIKLHRERDRDLLELLDAQASRQGFIKQVLREHLKRLEG